jgi:hypothetical protein
MHKKTLILLASFALAGCSTNGHSTLTGLGIGALSGASVGLAIDPGPKARYRTQNIGIGVATGAIVGAITGFLFHRNDKNTTQPKLLDGPSALDTANNPATSPLFQPELTQPKVETRFIDDQVKGSTFVPGHLEYQIVEPSKWNR